MASLGIQYRGNRSVFDHRNTINLHRDRCDQNAGPRSLAVSGRRSRSLVSSMKSLAPMEKKRVKKEVISRDKIDQWMKESVVDVVKNLREAPLFLRFYTSDDGTAARFETEKAVTEERWPVLEDQWETGMAPFPEGVMIVQQLEDDQNHDREGGGESKAWGIVIQGRGKERGAPVCYLLKTSSAAAGLELNLWCTHFCLVRVKNFRETAKSQLQNCWLLQNQNSWVFRRFRINDQESVAKILGWEEEFLSPNRRPPSFFSGSCPPPPSDWVPPELNFLKLNVDAAINSGRNKGGLGWVLRNHDGLILMAGCKEVNVNNSKFLEAMAIFEGLCSLDFSGLNVLVESDCLEVVNLLLRKSMDVTEISNIIDNIWNISEASKVVGFIHARRDCNKAAHKLAQMAALGDSDGCWKGFIPNRIISLIS